MLPYWLLLSFAVVMALTQPTPTAQAFAQGSSHAAWTPQWWLMLMLLTLFMGLRFEVGGDWFNYFGYLDRVAGLDIASTLALADPGYQLLNWISVELGWGTYGVNVVSALALSLGLLHFAQHQPRPWLAMAAAVPYLVIVVGMGYTRQGAALGFAMLGLIALGQQRLLAFAVWVIVGATFHKTAVLLLPIAALASTRNRYWSLLWVAIITGAAYTVLLEDSVDHLLTNYVEAGYQSEGALVRVLMNAVSAALLLWRFKRVALPPDQAPLWRWFAIISLLLLVVLLVSPSSTAVDRLALYMLPLQLVVASRLPEVFGRPGGSNTQGVLVVLAAYGAVQFVWLNFATHARYWLPYRNVLFDVF